jgi:hypothetical protein
MVSNLGTSSVVAIFDDKYSINQVVLEGLLKTIREPLAFYKPSTTVLSLNFNGSHADPSPGAGISLKGNPVMTTTEPLSTDRFFSTNNLTWWDRLERFKQSE